MIEHNGIRYREEDAERLGYLPKPEPETTPDAEVKARRETANKARTSASAADKAVRPTASRTRKGTTQHDDDGTPPAAS